MTEGPGNYLIGSSLLFYPLGKSGGHRYCGSRDVFNFSSDLPRPRDSRVRWVYQLKPIWVSYNTVKFGGHKDSVSGNIMALFITWLWKTTWSKSFVTFWLVVHHGKSSAQQIWLTYLRRERVFLEQIFYKARQVF